MSIVAGFLSDRNNAHAVLLQLSRVNAKLDHVAEETGEAVNHDEVERVGTAARFIDHALEGRPLIVCRARTGLDKFRYGVPALGFAVSRRLPPLIRD
ncbi:MAG TPA: hypothetical protein VMU87_16105 [Stellaceae bacterium]|nr:hypothetical protein [Stellaceae bacterium]